MHEAAPATPNTQQDFPVPSIPAAQPPPPRSIITAVSVAGCVLPRHPAQAPPSPRLSCSSRLAVLPFDQISLISHPSNPAASLARIRTPFFTRARPQTQALSRSQGPAGFPSHPHLPLANPLTQCSHVAPLCIQSITVRQRKVSPVKPVYTQRPTMMKPRSSVRNGGSAQHVQIRSRT